MSQDNASEAVTAETQPTLEDLTKRLGVLERKIAREKKARNMAENQLEQYSLEIYETNLSLKRALESATQKQAELEYLGLSSSYVASELPLNVMVDKIVDLTGGFSSASHGFYIISDKGKAVGGKLKQMWSLAEGWQEGNPFEEDVLSVLPLGEATLLDTWTVQSIKERNITTDQPIQTIFYTNFTLGGERIGWMAFFCTEEAISEELLSVLETAREHLLNGTRRRLADMRILKRNVQLQDSLNNLEKARKQLIQSEKMASLGQLAAGVAHEINNPVGFIRSNMEVLKEYLTDIKSFHAELSQNVKENDTLTLSAFEEACKKSDLDYIEDDSTDILKSNIEGLDRVKDIVDNLKGFSHSGDEALVPMSLPDCVTGALKIVANSFKYEHTIDNQLSESCPRIIGNTGQLQQVFVNLFVNAAYAMEGGGELSISHTEENDRVILHVKDTGSGMDEKTVKQLFTPFFTTKPVGVGTGLGLSVSYAILEAHDAQVVVDSEVGVGTTFNINFPMSTATEDS
ncbi:ATP-binding protein [Marinomonas sp. C2222]|uniref:histidine kinase n=1 Tax=Marinomonas sargassi TaxID=2984494 RepID=A0ABT2YUP9_9GAMM|nr:ATP-binding protein [Marinomonas sargassi]MCV2403334.1 ATP-binding protein [Marinomonas sargassi]